MTWLRRAAPGLAAAAVCVTLYWYGLQTWFMQDDFAWLRLAQGVLGGDSFWTALFAPMAQGTIRPWSERAFFLGSYALFGLDALPLRVWVFLTQIANLVLIGAIARRLTASRLAALLAPILWICGSTMFVVMTWTSVYNQALCALCLLLAFYCFIRYVESGSRRWYRLQWVPFLAGFGALETIVVYPLLALAFAPKYWRRVLPLFIPSAAFGAWHLFAVPKTQSETYTMYFDGSLFTTLWTYWQWALGAAQLEMGIRMAPWIAPAVTALLTLAVAASLILGRRLALFSLAWFLVTLGPLLPLKNHLSDYYLTIPTIGLAWLGSWAVARYRVVGGLAAALYLAVSIPAASIFTRASYEQTQAVRRTVLGVARAHQLHPRDVVLLAGLSEELYWNALRHRAFDVVGVPYVYAVPGSAVPAEGESWVMPAEPFVRALDRGEAVVYDVRGPRLRNITSLYRNNIAPRLATGPPQRVDVANPLLGYLLGPEWYSAHEGSRWMPKRATLRMAGPGSPGRSLQVSGACMHPLSMTVSAGGTQFPPVRVPPGNFEFAFPLPASLAGKQLMEVAVEVDRTFKAPPDGRDLGLAFGTFAIR